MNITLCQRTEIKQKALSIVKPSLKLLDIGSGIRPFTDAPTQEHICCEPYRAYVEALKIRFPHLTAFNMGWEEAIQKFADESVDTVLLIDVIEHLEKEKGLELLEKTLKMVKQQVVIFTPLGFFEQSHLERLDAWGFFGGKWQEHRSGWEPKDFKEVDFGTWEFFVCNNFHYYNNEGKLLPEPAGAFWAIWTAN